MVTLLEAALEYASRKWYVFPLKPGSKVPATLHGFKDSSIDPVQIIKWWTENPEYNLGISCGPSNLLVVDIDPRNLDEAGTILSERVTSNVGVSTGGGGAHYYFRSPIRIGEGSSKGLAAGVDIKRQGGYVVAPPSITTGPYEWVSEGTPEPLPEWLETLLEPRTRPSRVFGYSGIDPLDDRPGSLYNRSASYAEILEPHGWTKAYVGTEGQQYWTRPGKDEGTSGVSGGETDTFWCWSTSTSLDPEQSYNKFGLYAALNHDGDFAEAASALSGRYSGGVKVNGTNPERELGEEWRGPMVGKGMAEPPALVSRFLKDFVQYTAKQTDAFSGYSQGSAISLLSVVAGKSYADLSTGPLNLNTYIMLCGPSTRSRKSTVQGIAANLLADVLPDSFLADRLTGEGAIYNLAARSNRSLLWTPDEFGVMLSQIYTREFMKPLEELFLTLYGKTRYEYQRADSSVLISNVLLSILGASTPESVSLAGPNVSLGGLLPRFGVVFPASLPVPRSLSSGLDISRERQELVTQLRAVLAYCSQPKRVTFSPEALEILNGLETELAGVPTAIRLPVIAYKLAALLALSALESSVSPIHANDAALLVREFAAGAARLDTYLHRKSSDLELDRLIENVSNNLRQHGGSQFLQLISRELKFDVPAAKRVRDTMVLWGLITVDGNPEVWSLNERNP